MDVVRKVTNEALTANSSFFKKGCEPSALLAEISHAMKEVLLVMSCLVSSRLVLCCLALGHTKLDRLVRLYAYGRPITIIFSTSSSVYAISFRFFFTLCFCCVIEIFIDFNPLIFQLLN